LKIAKGQNSAKNVDLGLSLNVLPVTPPIELMPNYVANAATIF